MIQQFHKHFWYLLYRQTSPGGVRLSRAAILQKGIEYIAYLNEQSAKQQEQLESLKKEVTALRIMKENYERITRVQSVHQNSAAQGSSELQIPEELKFRVVMCVCLSVCLAIIMYYRIAQFIDGGTY